MAMRLLSILVVVAILWPVSSPAQTRKSTRADSRQADPPRPSIGLPLPPIGLPLPRLGLPIADEVRAPSHDRRRVPHRPGGRDRRFKRPAGIPLFFVVPPYAWDSTVRTSVPGVIADDDAPEPAANTGRLRLELPPLAGIEIYIDGYYIGTPADLHGDLELPAGPHRLEIRAPGYDTTVVDILITEGRSVTYRAELTPLSATPPAPAPPREPDRAGGSDQALPPSTFYYIPGCYMGNVPPEQVKLPPGCDISRVITRTP